MRWMWIVAIAGCHHNEAASTVDAVPVDSATPDAGPSCPTMTTIDPTTAPELSIGSDPTVALGIFDPSVVYPATAMAGAMAYSAVPDQHSILTRIAVSSDRGTTWSYAADANEPEAATLQSISGSLMSEVPSLVFDADEPDSTRMWKLFSHRYLVEANNTLHYDIGTIAFQTAPSPAGPWTVPEKLIGWGSGSAYSATDVVVNIDSLAGDSDCVTLTEPGAIWLPGTLDLALGCVYPAGAGAAIRVILVRSVDHGASWNAVSTLLTPNDSECLVPGGSINAADLFVTGGQEYVVATSGLADGTYRGCAVYPIDDPAAGTVRRAPDGVAYPIRTMAATVFSGACTFADGGGGYLMDIGLFTEARLFHIFHAGASL